MSPHSPVLQRLQIPAAWGMMCTSIHTYINAHRVGSSEVGDLQWSSNELIKHTLLLKFQHLRDQRWPDLTFLNLSFFWKLQKSIGWFSLGSDLEDTLKKSIILRAVAVWSLTRSIDFDCRRYRSGYILWTSEWSEWSWRKLETLELSRGSHWRKYAVFRVHA